MLKRLINGKPAPGSILDLSNPLCDRLAVCVPFFEGSGLPVNLITNRLPVLTLTAGSIDWTGGIFNVRMSGATTPVIDYNTTIPRPYRYGIMGHGTVFACFKSLGYISSEPSVYVLDNSQTPGGRRWLTLRGTDANVITNADMYIYSGGSNFFNTGNITRADFHSYCTTWGITADTGLNYLDGGVPKAFTNTTSFNTAATTQCKVQGNAGWKAFLVWDRILSWDEIKLVDAIVRGW